LLTSVTRSLSKESLSSEAAGCHWGSQWQAYVIPLCVLWSNFCLDCPAAQNTSSTPCHMGTKNNPSGR
jgi:hypothetical protein